MNQFAQAALVASISSGASEWGAQSPASNATKIARFVGEGEGLRDRLPTNKTCRLIERADLLQAILANWQARNIYERSVADTAISWKQCCEKAFGGAFCPIGERTSLNPGNGLIDASSVPATAEDDLPRAAELGVYRTV